MSARIEGKIFDIDGNVVTLNVNGVGYEVFASRASLEGKTTGDDAHFVIYTDVKEDLIRLYGFRTKTEKQVFLFLKAVKGVGAKSASDIVSGMDSFDLLRAIGAGDVTRLQSVRGVGKKTAERIVVELKDRVAEYVNQSRGLRGSVEVATVEPQEDALAALEALGFSSKDAARAISEVAGQMDLRSLEPGEIVKQALRYV